jgi:hypothetical protein
MTDSRPGQKPLKKHEKITLLKHRIKEAEVQAEFFMSRVDKDKRKFKELQEYHKTIEKESWRQIEKLERIQADWYDEIQNRKLALRTFDAPKIQPKPQENGNGKQICDICEKEFSKQGYPAHRKKCEKLKAEQEKLEKLKKELESDLEGEE